MHKWFGGLGGHDHSHGPGKKCGGHGHGHGGHPHGEMSEEMRAAMLQQLEMQMQMMTSGQVLSHGHVLHDPSSPDPRPYNALVYGYGHDPMPPAYGWGYLAEAPAQMTDAVMPVNADDAQKFMTPAQRDRFWLLRVALLGRLRIVKDAAGLAQASVVVLYWLYGNFSLWSTILIPYYDDGVLPISLLLLFAVVSILCITSFVRASTLNPGSLHVNHKPQDDWQMCQVCGVKRPPLSHHCRRCGQCVRRMDHHCPWINNCVGEENQFAFMQLLLYAFLLSFISLIFIIIYFVWLEDCLTCNKSTFVIQHQNAILYVALVLAVMMTSASLGLMFTQHINIIHEVPTVEWMKLQREMIMTGVMPTQMMKESRPVCDVYEEMCGSQSVYLWLCPCRRRASQPFTAAGAV